jgi:hypothetical protein
MSSYSERIANLSPSKLELLAQQLKAKTARAAKVQPIPRRPTAQTPPLSFAQQRLWFLDQLTPGGATYNMPVAIRLVGQLNVGVLSRSLNEIISRHEVLRTSFPSIDGQPVQVIAASARIELALLNLREIPAAERESAHNGWRTMKHSNPSIWPRARCYEPLCSNWMKLCTSHC